MRLSGRVSLTLRLTVLFATVSTVVLLALGYLIGGTVAQHFVEQDLDLLGGKLDSTRRLLESVHDEAGLAGVPQALDDALLGQRGLAIAVAAPDGRVLFATRDAELPETLLAHPADQKAVFPVEWRSARGIPMRGIAQRVATGIPGAPPAVVAVAIDIAHHERYMADFRVTLWSFVAVAALLSGVLGWLVARRGLAPLQAIRRKTEDITAERLDARLMADDVPAELAALVDALNAMLARLEVSFRRLSDFSSDLAHEFRTPVSNLMMQSQVVLSRPRDAETYREVLASSVEEYERLSRMIADMLFLAKADEGRIVPSRERLELAPLLDDLLEFHRFLAEDKAVAIVRIGDGTIHGDALMIRRAIGNLLSNALRYVPAGGWIEAAVRSDAGQVRIEIANSGEPIPAEHLTRLFDRFYRVDAARTGEGGHSGLGLAIVKSIVEAQGGRVTVSSMDGATRFVMSFAATT